MATSASIRLPLRTLVRSGKANSFIRPSTTSPSTILSRRSISDASSPYPQEEEDTWLRASPFLPRSAGPEDRRIPTLPIRSEEPELPPSAKKTTLQEVLDAKLRLPRSVQAVYLRPLRREATYGVPACDLQLRSYNVRNLEFFCDFALRAAYYLGLPASGPVPLPRITERWTVPRGSFIHKKSQENFERRTVRRLIQIKDAEPEVVEVWLGFLRKYAYYGIGMKANVWEFTGLSVSKDMDATVEKMKENLDETLAQFAFSKRGDMAEKAIEVINRENARMTQGGSGPMQRLSKVGPGPKLGSNVPPGYFSPFDKGNKGKY